MKGINQEPYSGQQFLSDLNREWGGNLYFGIIPPNEANLVDIRPKLLLGFTRLAEQTSLSKPIETITITSNPARDFRKIAIEGMPHSNEARDRLHILADPYCRDFLHEQLEWMLEESLEPKPESDVLIVRDALPFTFDGPESEIFNSPLVLPSFGAHLARVKSRAEMLGGRLDLKPDELSRFVDQIHLGMDRTAEYVKLIETDQGEDLHPIIQVSAGLMLAEYTLRPKGPSFL